MILPFKELLKECERLHGHLCPGQVLGVRMALLGCELLGINDPKGADRKKLIVWVEIDRCMTDAISAVTGVRLGRRSLKFLDYGKVAATFFNLETGKGVRLLALESSRELADERYPHLPGKKDRQMLAYEEADVQDLFKIQNVTVEVTEFDLPGRPRSRVNCQECGEAVNDRRELSVGEAHTLCRACALGAYYQVHGSIGLVVERQGREDSGGSGSKSR